MLAIVLPPTFSQPPGIDIVDGHVHLTNMSEIVYTWQNAIPKLNHTFTLGNLSVASAGAVLEPKKVVFCEVSANESYWGKEVEYIAGVAEEARRMQYPIQIGAIVAHVAVEKGAAHVRDVMEAFEKETELVKGVREGESSGFLTNASFVEGVKELGRMGKVFELLVSTTHLSDALTLVRSAPNVRFALDHMGGPDIAAGNEGFEEWKPKIDALAREPNVYAMISGAPGDAAHGVFGNWTIEEIRPFIQHTITQFGFKRSYFAGNWFFLDLAGTYHSWTKALVTIVNETLQPTDEDWRDLLQNTANTVYKMS